jgi:tetratricopeptide (TPR) repeat protein
MPEPLVSPKQRFTLLIVAALVLALRFIAFAIETPRLWGFDFFRHLDLTSLLVYSVAALVAALPQTHRLIETWVGKKQRQWAALAWGGVLFLFVTVMLFPMQTFYYGDGGPLISEIYKIGAQEHYSSEMVMNLHSAPLAGLLIHLLSTLIPSVMHALGLSLPETPMFPFLGLSVLAAMALGTALHLEKETRLRLPILLLLLGTGGALLFFRYAEMYLPVFVAVSAYLLAASAVLRGERPLWLALLLYAVAVAAHYMALALLPSLLFLLSRDSALVKRLTGSGRALALSFAAMLGVAFALYFALGFHHSDSRAIMPLLPVETPAGTLNYTLLSSYHLIDLLNLLLLLAVFPLALLLTGRMGAEKRTGMQKKSSDGRDAETAGTGSAATGDGIGDALRFQLIAGYSFLLFLFFANTSLGLARDWDVAAPLGAMLVMIYVEYRRGRNVITHRSGSKDAGSKEVTRQEIPAHAGLLQAGLVSVLLVVPWIAVNVNVESSTARFAEIMALDDGHMYGDYALSGYEALRKQAVHAGDFEREGEILRRMIEIVGYTEQYRMLVANAVYYADKNPSRYFSLNDWMLERLAAKGAELRAAAASRDYAIGLKQIDSLAAVMAIESVTHGHWRTMRPRFESFAQRTGCATAARILTGTELYGKQEFGAGIPVFEHVRAAGFRDPRVDGMYGSCLYVAGDRARGNAEFEDGLKRHGDNPQYLFMVATAYLQRDGRFAEARALLERALTLSPPDDARAQITGLLDDLRAYTEGNSSGPEPAQP